MKSTPGCCGDEDAPPTGPCVDHEGRRCSKIRGRRATVPAAGSQSSARPCTCVTGCPPALNAAAGHLSECWAVIGVLSITVELFSEGETARRLIRRNAERFGRERQSVCFRFVLGALPVTKLGGNSSVALERLYREELEHRDIVRLRAPDENCGAKAFAWFQHAVAAFPGAAWIGKADSDTFVNVEALQADLAALDIVNGLAVVGQFNWLDWATVNRGPQGGNTSDTSPGRPCGRARLMHDVAPRSIADHMRRVSSRRQDLRACAIDDAVSSRPYPFAVGPLYLLSARLAHHAFSVEAARHFASQQRFECAAEDATVGYFVHSRAAVHGLKYTLAHISWTKLHNFDMYGVLGHAGGPPGIESVAIHFLKPNIYPKKLRLRFQLLWSWLWFATRSSVPRCWPLVRFVWHPAPGAQTVRCLDPVAWWLTMRRCSSSAQFCRPSAWPASHWSITPNPLSPRQWRTGIWSREPPSWPLPPGRGDTDTEASRAQTAWHHRRHNMTRDGRHSIGL